MKLTKIMIIIYFFAAILIFVFACKTSYKPVKGDILFCAVYLPLAPVVTLILLALTEKARSKVNDKTEQKAFKIAKILSNILFLLLYFCWIVVWVFIQM